jgi:3-methyladenine DNA glycosylase AlkD
METEKLYREIVSYCKQNADEAIVKKYSRYFKGGYIAYGLTQDLLHNKAKEILDRKEMNLELALEVSRMLVKMPEYEGTSFALLLTKEYHKKFDLSVFHEIEGWFQLGITNWAHTDATCWILMPLLFKKKIITFNSLSEWRFAKNKFQRRAVPVSMIKLLKETPDYKLFFDFIEPMMNDPEREVHQGLGWFLREAWKIKPPETEVFLTKYKNTAPRLIFQYATEKVTKENKERFRKEK